jgi:hypothetical protein
MIELSPYEGLCHQLKEQGLKFKDSGYSKLFKKMLLNIEDLYMADYISLIEYKKIKKRCLEDLKKYTSKIEK